MNSPFRNTTMSVRCERAAVLDTFTCLLCVGAVAATWGMGFSPSARFAYGPGRKGAAIHTADCRHLYPNDTPESKNVSRCNLDSKASPWHYSTLKMCVFRRQKAPVRLPGRRCGSPGRERSEERR